ncbi:HDIG domain-containing protein [Prevotella melaninogenica]|uniref:HD family phosphohydrolase n=1 Tax=Prevotella TaxID=838 RepID=UPI0003AD5D92|nr:MULTISPECIES: HDIG domain-containing metalloprotein [Prevotella]ERJ80111.1 7TM receptor with intracellular HD hydrolase [Prevotella sp. F0091]QUB74493.1 HDIG domain-containing protein [Prevotella melaninogenica]
MIRFKNISNPYWRNMVSRTVLVIVAVVLIVLFLPRTQGKLFHYDEGKPWMYGQLIAKFDFPIFKTEAALKIEKDSITKHFQPYYNINQAVEQKKIEQFKQAYKNGIPGLSQDYVDAIAHRLHEIYEAGIIDPQQYSTLAKDSNSLIRVVTGKQAVSVPINKTYSTLGAYEQLFMDPLLGPKRSLLQQCNLNEYIEANLVYDKDRSETEMNDMLSLIPQASGMVLEGQRIIDRGDIVDAKTYRVLNSFEQAMEKRKASEDEITSTFIGQTIYVLIFICLFTLYLALFRKDYFNKPRSISLLYVMIVIYPILTSLMMEHNILSVYILPFSMAPIFFRVFMDSRTAFIGHITMVLLCAVAVKYQYEFIIVQIVAGLVAIYSLRELSKRSQIFLTALLVTISSAAVYLSLQLIQADDLSKLDQTMYYHFAVNGFFLLFTYPLMLVIEKTFGFVSTVTMFELSNTNNELLRRLSEVAPGTFQHSITVGNLATEIASRIGAKSQLVRTGALYHDIGKMLNPAFFTENQAGINPHDKLNDLESARIIISHVTEGLKLAEKYNLPREIKEFITTHHGTGLAKYFYIHYKNEHPDEEVNEDLFRYPGPNPFTREQAILMMSDTVEAASRSLQEYTEESISELVNRLIDGQVADGNFTDCPITFRDITAAKTVLIERLKSMYHTRIQYPQLKT